MGLMLMAGSRDADDWLAGWLAGWLVSLRGGSKWIELDLLSFRKTCGANRSYNQSGVPMSSEVFINMHTHTSLITFI